MARKRLSFVSRPQRLSMTLLSQYCCDRRKAEETTCVNYQDLRRIARLLLHPGRKELKVRAKLSFSRFLASHPFSPIVADAMFLSLRMNK